jgi:hypothetical protein
VTYEGEQFVRQRGARSKRIAPQTVRHLLEAALRTHFFGPKPCYPQAPDSASFEITVRTEPHARPRVQVLRDSQCTTEHAARFADEIDAQTDTSAWITCPVSAPEPCRSYK